MSKPTVLQANDYIHVMNTESGVLELIEGPVRFVLPANKTVSGSVQQKIVLKEGQYIYISNPYSAKTGGIEYGVTELRVGPKIFALYPAELASEVRTREILNNSQALVIKAFKNFESKKAGEIYIVRGPTTFIPSPYEEIVRRLDAVSIAENEALYVQDINTSQLRVVKGPASYVPDVNEQLYSKTFPDDVYTALQIPREPSPKALVVNLQKNECVCIKDLKTNVETFFKGPDSRIIGPYETVKIVTLSGGVPKKWKNATQSATVSLGPDFCEDAITIRTQDNAVLKLTLSYKFRFIVADETLYKLFEGDFLGYVCECLRSRIREVASKVDFEHFHTSASQMLCSKLFADYKAVVSKDGKQTTPVRGIFFEKFNFLIFEMDVKRIVPKDPQIAELLDRSIKSSMKIMCQKLNENAEFESQKEKIESEKEIARLNKSLIEIKNTNYQKETLEQAKIEGAAKIEDVKARVAANELLENSRIELDLAHMKDQMNLLAGKSGAKYIEYVKALSMNNKVGQVTVLPKNVQTLYLPMKQQY